MVELALDLIAEEGLAACSFRNLADREGRSTRPFTYEFGNRTNLLAAVLHESWQRLGFKPGEEPEPGSDPLAQLFELCSRAVPLNGLRDPAMRAYSTILCHSIEDPALAKVIASADGAGIGTYTELIRAAQRKGQIRKNADPEDLIVCIWALGDGLIIASFTHPDEFDADRIRRIWNLGFNSLVAGH